MRATRKITAIGVVDIRRFMRDRLNLFFVFIFPIAMILVIGLQFAGNQESQLGVVGGDGDTREAILDIVRDADVEVVEVGDRSDLEDRVESTDLDAGIVVPDDLDAVLSAGEAASIEVVASGTARGQQVRLVVDGAVARVAGAPTAVAAAVERGADPGEAAQVASTLGDPADAIAVETVTTGEELFPDDLGQYDVAAPAMLVLFVFVNGLTGSYALIQVRQLGLARRMMSTPTSVGTIIWGSALGRWFVGMIQGLYILIATVLLFGMRWGDPLAAAVILVLVAAVSAGAAMVFGSVFSNPDQASGIGVVVALVLAAMGGAMMPIELFSDTMASIARVTPHYWAIDAFAELVRHDGTLLDVLPQLGVLTAMAAGLLALAAWRLRSVLARGG